MLSPVRSIHTASGLLVDSIRSGGVSVKESGELTGIGRGVTLNVQGASDATGVMMESEQALRFKSQGGGVICVASVSFVTRLTNCGL